MSGWIGVDLDGTLANYTEWDGSIGPPVFAMLARVKRWLQDGKEVRIFTARVAEGDVWHQHALITAWCLKHIGQALPITCKKDFGMIELWDDRAIQVIPNTGERVDGGKD